VKPRILTLDIETSPHDAYVWNLWGDNVPLARLKSPTKMLCWAAKFVGEKPEWRQYRDPDFLSRLRSLLNEADIVVTYNGIKFDMPHINREFAEAGIPPARPCAHIDLLAAVKKTFKFPSNRLEYVAKTLLGIHKLDTGGFGLWPAFMEGDEKAQRLMQRYNIQDVRVTEKLYLFLRPWIRLHPYAGGQLPEIDDYEEPYQCPACLSRSIRLERPRRTRCYAIRVLECKDCGHWFEGKRRKI
jgi:DNA polymerase elongation subunit (family B)